MSEPDAKFRHVGQVTFTPAEWDAHQEGHAEPRLGCPCCFLALADCYQYAEQAERAAKVVLGSHQADAESKRYARRVLLDLENRQARVLLHMRAAPPAEGALA